MYPHVHACLPSHVSILIYMLVCRLMPASSFTRLPAVSCQYHHLHVCLSYHASIPIDMFACRLMSASPFTHLPAVLCPDPHLHVSCRLMSASPFTRHSLKSQHKSNVLVSRNVHGLFVWSEQLSLFSVQWKTDITGMMWQIKIPVISDLCCICDKSKSL